MKKNTIGIMTFHRAHNYGALLQAYAMQMFLEKENNVFFLDYYNKKIYDGYKIIKPLGKNLIKWPKRIFENIKNYKKNKEKYNTFNYFINNYLKIKKYNKIEINKCDILITGSDQVWNPRITGGLLNEYALNFGKSNIKRISYAASCGNENNIKKYSNKLKKKLKIINYISIREESYKKELEKILNKKNIDVVLDPTLILTKEKWNDCISNIEKIINEKYILAYVVEPDDEFVKIANELSNKTGLKIVSFSEIYSYKNEIKNNKTYNPLEFIKLIKDAEYIVTTSFHATTFSIIFNKNFWVVPHKQTGSRVKDLLKKLDLSDRVINSLDEFKTKEIKKNINYSKTNKLLNEQRKKSIDWLYNAIKR